MSDKKDSLNLKFPYPVLNDKRDLKAILEILEEKEDDLSKKLEQTKKSYKQTDKQDEKRKEKLKNLYKNYKSQLNKIEKQLDFIRIQVKIKKIQKNREKKKDKEYKKEDLEELKNELEELTKFMKEANKAWLNENKETVKKSKLSDSDDDSQSVKESEAVVVIGPAQPPPGYLFPSQNSVIQQQHSTYQPQYYPAIFDHEKLNELITQNIAVAIAQTAAAAHAAAALTAAAYNPPPPPSLDEYESSAATTTPLPSRNEIEHAKETFEKYKSKISQLIGNKQVKDQSSIKLTDSFKNLLAAYDTKDDKTESDEIKEVDDSTPDDMSDTEIELVFKSNEKLMNYILPSTKSCRLQCTLASSQDKYLNYPHEIIYDNQTKHFLPSQLSSSSLTLMGNRSILTKGKNLANILYK